MLEERYKKYATEVVKTLKDMVVCMCLFSSIQAISVHAQGSLEKAVDAVPQDIKAFKTLNFGDNTEVVTQKLTAILGTRAAEYPNYVPTATISFFDTISEYDSSKSSGEDQAFKDYLSDKIGTVDVLGENDVISVNCYHLGTFSNNREDGLLAIVEVNYKNYDLVQLTNTFEQAFPNAHVEMEAHKIECPSIPGVSFQFERKYLIDVNSDRRAILSLPTKEFTFTFTEPSKMSSKQLAGWEALMTQNNQTNLNQYFDSVKNSLLQAVTNMEAAGKLDGYSLALLGIEDQPPPNDLDSVIYGAPIATFASKQILDPLINGYRQSFIDEAQQKKIKLQKESQTSSGF